MEGVRFLVSWSMWQIRSSFQLHYQYWSSLPMIRLSIWKSIVKEQCILRCVPYNKKELWNEKIYRDEKYCEEARLIGMYSSWKNMYSLRSWKDRWLHIIYFLSLFPMIKKECRDLRENMCCMWSDYCIKEWLYIKCRKLYNYKYRKKVLKYMNVQQNNKGIDRFYKGVEEWRYITNR